MKVFESPAFLGLPFVERAKFFAHFAHDSIGQKRKYSGEPYWVHTDQVASIFAEYFPNDEVGQAICHLHDVLEDVFTVNPEFSPELIEKLFGPEVRSGVEDLTDEYVKEKYPHLNRAERKRRECKKKAKICARSQSAKLCDLIANTGDIVSQDPSFAKTYIREKQEFLPYLLLGDVRLWVRAANQAEQGRRKLNGE